MDKAEATNSTAREQIEGLLAEGNMLREIPAAALLVLNLKGASA